MKQIETKRLILREWEAKDAEGLYSYAKNPNVGPNAGWKPHASVEESLEIINQMFIPNQVWAMVDKATGQIIGSIGFEPDKRRPNIESKEMGYSLAEEFWGKGIMTEAAAAAISYAFLELKLDLLAICTGPNNFRSQRVIDKNGFVFEGTEREAYKIFDGTRRDVRCYSLLRREWEARQ